MIPTWLEVAGICLVVFGLPVMGWAVCAIGARADRIQDQIMKDWLKRKGK